MNREEWDPAPPYNPQNTYQENEAQRNFPMPANPQNPYYAQPVNPAFMYSASVPSTSTLRYPPQMGPALGTPVGAPMNPNIPPMAIYYTTSTPDSIVQQLQQQQQQNQLGSYIYIGVFISLFFSPVVGVLALLCVPNGIAFQSTRKGVGIGWIIYAIFITIAGVLTYTLYSCSESYMYGNNEGVGYTTYNGIYDTGTYSVDFQSLCEQEQVSQQHAAIGLFCAAAFFFIVGVGMVRLSNRSLRNGATTSPQNYPVKSYSYPPTIPQPIYSNPYQMQYAQPYPSSSGQPVIYQS